MASRWSPTLDVGDGDIVYAHDGRDLWRLPIQDLALVGDHTDPSGPFVDDDFFVFADSSDHSWWEASFYSDGRDDFLAAPSQRPGAGVATGLCGSTDYDSRVMWPPDLRNAKLFSFVRVRPEGMRGKVRQWIFEGQFQVHFTEDVRGYLASRHGA